MDNLYSDQEKARQEQTFIEAKEKRDKRKELTQRFRGSQLTNQDLIEAGIEIEGGISAVFDISIKREYQESLSKEKCDNALRRAADLLDLTGRMDSMELELMREAIHEKWEKEPIRNVLLPAGNIFLKAVDSRKGAVHPRARVKEQRDSKKHKVESLIGAFENFVGNDKNNVVWQDRGNGESKAEYKLRVLEKIKELQGEDNNFIQNNFSQIGYNSFDELEKDIDYYNRVDAEGTKVHMAMQGLRAFNKLLEISKSQGDRKEKLIADFTENSSLISGLAGSNVNPTLGNPFGVVRKDGKRNVIAQNVVDDISHPLWNIITQNPEELTELCQNAGKLFDRAIDFEREILKSETINSLTETLRGKHKNLTEELLQEKINQAIIRRQDELDREQVVGLYKISAEAIVFMFQTFNHLQGLLPEMQDVVQKSFTNSFAVNQGWDQVKISRTGRRGKETITGSSLLEEGMQKLNRSKFRLKTETEEQKLEIGMNEEFLGQHTQRLDQKKKETIESIGRN